jgi:hypothetical protein
MNLDAVLRIAAKVTGTGAVEQLNKALGSAERTADRAKGAFKSVISSSSWQAAAAAAAGIGTALALSAKAAIDFESSVAEVRKVMEGLDDPRALSEIREEILQLSREMPITAQGFAQIYAAAGQAGIARGEVQAFARDVARMSIAFGMTAEEAGRSMAAMRSALGLTQPEVVSLADAINFLGNNMGATEPQIVEFLERAGAMGRLAGMAAEQTAAFGATMLSMGTGAEVAATSFNNLIRGLSRGASMTDRQESALQRLGLASRTVASGQAELTAAIQRGSDRRLEIIQDESDRQQDELRRRYRRQLQLFEDQWDDETEAYTDALRDQADAQIKALQRQAEDRIKILQKQAGDNDEWLDAQTDAVRDQLEVEIDLIRDATDRRLKLQQRADRDRRQQVRDGLDAQMDDELKALERMNKQRVEAEKAGTKEALDAAKAVAEQGGSEAGRNLAKRLQDDALGTIRDVFARIRGLAAEERISVISDLFGDETRGLAPLINNMGELERALGLVGDKTKYAGSMQQEFERRAATTANRIQLLKNSVVPLQVAIGEGLLPVINGLTAAMPPLIGAITKWLAANPALAQGLSLVAAAIAGLVAALPAISSIATILAAPGVAAGLTAMAAGFALIAVKAVIVAGAVAGISYAFMRAWESFAWFRDNIIAGLGSLGEAWKGFFLMISGILQGDGAKIQQGFIDMWFNIGKSMRAALNILVNVMRETFNWVVRQVAEMPRRVASGALAIGRGIGNGIASAVRSIFGGMMRWMADRINWMAEQVNRLIRKINRTTGSKIGELGQIQVPAFAQGGFVTGPTVGLIGEAGREYVVPEAKAPQFANNIIAGRRGAAAIPTGTSGGSGGGSVSINITTGPVMQDASGQRWMTIEDGERMVREAAAQVLRTQRTPGGRYASGVR